MQRLRGKGLRAKVGMWVGVLVFGLATCVLGKVIGTIYVEKVINAQVINASSYTSSMIDCTQRANQGYFSLQYSVVAGTNATVDFTYLLSNDGVTFATPSTADDIATGVGTASSLVSFNPEPAKWIEIRATVSASTNATVNAWLMAQ